MEQLIAVGLVIALLIVFEVKSSKHAKPVKENLEAVRRMKSVAKVYRPREDRNV